MQIRPGYEPGLKCETKRFKTPSKLYQRKGKNTMTNTVNSKGQLVRWESYERDKNYMVVSKWENYYVVVSFGKKPVRGTKKDRPIKTYRVTKDEAGEVHCTCPSHTEQNDICKHMLAVREKARRDRQQEEEQKKQEIEKIIARW